jgi:RHS repeat-associated protein
MIAAQRKPTQGPWIRRGLIAGCALVFALVTGAPVAGQALADDDTPVPAEPPLPVSVQPLDLNRTPDDDTLSAAGQLGGALYPVEAPDAQQDQTSGGTAAPSAARRAAGNRAFGRAIQRWNGHDWKEATTLFRQHLTDFPDSPWAAEAQIHLACEARYQGRYNEAEGHYQSVLARTKDSTDSGAQRLANKARMRLAETKTLRNNLDAATAYFGELEQNGLDWRERTYAGHWLHRLAVQKSQELSFLNCGYLALGDLLAGRGEQAGAQAVLARQAQSTDGQSLQELKDLAGQYGLALNALRLTTAELDQVPLPAIVHIPGQAEGDKGHFWILHSKRGELLKLHDPQSGRWFRQTVDEFSGEWQGVALVFAGGDAALPGVPLDETELAQLTGGCCGVARPESDQGDPDADPKDDTANEPPGDGDDCGECFWSVNPVNMNLYVSDMPLWYDPPTGPKVGIKLSYNSQSANNQHEPFGNKWQFNYGTYLVLDPGDTVTLYMPDGRRDIFTGDTAGHYTPPANVHNRLTNLGGQRWELRFADDSTFIYDIPAGTSSMQPFLVEAADAFGQKLSFGYNAAVQLTTITDALGQVTRLVYNTAGLVTTVTDPFSRVASFQYDAGRNLTQITDMGGYWSRLTYDATVYLTSIEKADGTWRFLIEPTTVASNGSNPYPAPGAVMWENYRITTTEPAGAKSEWYYNGYSGYSWHISPRHYIPWQSETVNNFRSGTPMTRFNLDRNSSSIGQISSVVYPGQGQESYQHDSQGNVTRVTRPDGGVYQYAYNTQGRVTSLTDPRGKVTTLVYAANGLDLLSVTDARGSIGYQYNEQHQVTRVTDRRGNKTAFVYNNYGQLTQITAAEGTVTEAANTLFYGTDRRLARVNKAGQILIQVTYDPIGRVRTQTDGSGFTLTYDYDALNQLTRITYPDGRNEQFAWSTRRPFLLVQETARSDKANRYAYDPERRLTESIAPDGALTRQIYDPDGNLTKLIDANGKPTAFAFDADGLATAETYADGKGSTYTYDAAGRVKTRTNARGIRTTYSYDQNGNLTLIDYADNTPDVALVYDAFNRLIQRTDGLGVSRFTYDANDNLTSADGPWDVDTITYTYDAQDRRIGMTPQGGTAVTYGYDTLGRLATVAHGTRNYALTYQGNSNLVARLTRPNGSFSTYTNDALQRLTALGNYKSDNSVINRFDYSYNTDDQRAAETVTNGLAMVTQTPGLETMQVNALNQVTSATNPARTYQYDADGNMTRGYTPAGYVWTAGYDAENRLTRIEYTDAAGAAHATEYAYHGNHLVGRIRQYNGSVLVDESRQVRDGFLTVQDRGADNLTDREYLWRDSLLGGAGRLLSLIQQEGIFDYLMDGRKNVVLLLSSTQQIVAHYRYGPYGQLVTDAGTLRQPFTYATKRIDRETGVYGFGYRYYSAQAARWMTRDPLGFIDGANLYAYLNSDPINRIDPLGLFRFDKRPLSGAPWLGPASSNPVDDYFNTEISHEHGFFEDGSGDNIGFAPGGRFSEDPTGLGYRTGSEHYDDDIMREALKNVKDGEYSLFDNNCQDWAERLRDEYRKILEERKKENCR